MYDGLAIAPYIDKLATTHCIGRNTNEDGNMPNTLMMTPYISV